LPNLGRHPGAEYANGESPMKSTSCTWFAEFEDDMWSTDCGNYFQLNDGTPSDNEMKFCCFCGKEIEEEVGEEE
jgi:hypothetical protein